MGQGTVMKLAVATVAYREERFMPKFIMAMQDRVDEILVLNSTKPWEGENEPNQDRTAAMARSLGATVVAYDWKSEEDQRNAGQEFLCDYDWIIVLDPDEYFDNDNWNRLVEFLEVTDADAVIVQGQYTYWKNGYVADPPRDYPQLVAVRPHVRFVDKRVVGSNYVVAPVWVHHFSWARTNEEVLRKITHYAHAKDFNIKEWYEDVWLKWKPGMIDVHPITPDTLHNLLVAQLPPEIERLDLWP